MKNKSSKIKAVILAAGIGSRIRPLTDNCPKSLLEIGGNTILEMMISNIQSCGINKVVFVSNKGDISSILANGFVEQLGYKNIYSLKGGIQEWIKKGNKINI